MFGFLFSKKKRKRKSALELIGAFTALFSAQMEMEEIENEPLTAESKKALIYGLMLAGAIDAICQAFEQDDLTWAIGVQYGIGELKFPEVYTHYIIQLHQILCPNDPEFQIILEGGNMARQWMSNKSKFFSILFEFSPYIEPFIKNDSISNSIGEILVKYKLLECHR